MGAQIELSSLSDTEKNERICLSIRECTSKTAAGSAEALYNIISRCDLFSGSVSSSDFIRRNLISTMSDSAAAALKTGTLLLNMLHDDRALDLGKIINDLGDETTRNDLNNNHRKVSYLKAFKDKNFLSIQIFRSKFKSFFRIFEEISRSNDLSKAANLGYF